MNVVINTFNAVMLTGLLVVATVGVFVLFRLADYMGMSWTTG